MKTLWVLILLNLAAIVAVQLGAQTSESGSATTVTDGADRFAPVIEAVTSNPEMAVAITGELVRNFPDSAPSIVVSVIEGLPERDDEALDAIVTAAVRSAPEQRAAIELAVADFLADLDAANGAAEASSMEAVGSLADASNGEADAAAAEIDESDTLVTDVAEDDAETPEAGEIDVSEADETEAEVADAESVRPDLSRMERPERLAREVAIMESLIGTFPDRVPATVRRSVGRVADEEAFWSLILVTTAIERVPESEDLIIAEAIEAAPHHEEAIHAYFAEEAVAESEVPEASEDEVLEMEERELPDRLIREIQLVRSLIGTFPDNAADAVRRSIRRVSDEDAFWTVAIVWAALTDVPEQESQIVEAAIAAAPHHEEEIRFLMEQEEPLDLEVALTDGEEVEEELEEVAGPFTIENAVETIELIEDRLRVRFDVALTQPSRVRIAVQSLELSIRPERYFDPYLGQYLERDMATITGDGIVGLGFRVNPKDPDQIAGLSEVMATFTSMTSGAGDFVASIMADDDAGLLLRDVRTDIGDVYFYPSKRNFSAQFAGNFQDRTYSLRLGGAVSLTRETVPAVRHLLENLERYQDEYRSRLDARERQLELFHQFTQKPIREVAKEDEKEES